MTTDEAVAIWMELAENDGVALNLCEDDAEALRIVLELARSACPGRCSGCGDETRAVRLCPKCAGA